MLEKPFAFYGGYLQLASTKRDDFLHQKFVEKLLNIIKQLRYENQKILEDKEAVSNVAQMNFELAQRDADRISLLSKQLATSNKTLNLELKR